MEVGATLDARADEEPGEEADSGRGPIPTDELEVGVSHPSKDAELVEVGGAKGIITFGTEREGSSVRRAIELDVVEHELKRGTRLLSSRLVTVWRTVAQGVMQWENSSGIAVARGPADDHTASQNAVRPPSPSLTREMVR
jgi:hypothetical protein